MTVAPIAIAAITNSRILPTHVTHKCIAVQRPLVLPYWMQDLIPNQLPSPGSCFRLKTGLYHPVSIHRCTDPRSPDQKLISD